MSGNSNSSRAAEFVGALLHDTRFQFKDMSGYLRKGICPDCGKKELYVRKSEPWRVACGRENKCGSSFTVKELLPHLFEDYIKRYPPTPANPKATADAYLMEDRGFNMVICRSWYSQETHRLKETGEGVPTVRFFLDQDKTRFWERLIGKTKADGQKVHIGGQRKKDGSLFKGDAWQPPGQQLDEGDECFITEGIFHAIALSHVKKKTAAAISCSNFPSNLIEANKGKGIKWVLALDPDKAGKKFMAKHRKIILAVGEEVEVALLPNCPKDWDDYWKEGKLDEKFLAECFYNGTLFTAESVIEKCFRIFCRYPAKLNHVIEFRNALYSVKVDSKFASDLQEQESDLTTPEERDYVYPQFQARCTVDLVCNVNPSFLYVEKDDLLDDQRYVFQIHYKNGTPAKLMCIEGTALTSCDAFNKALLNKTNGGRFPGNNRSFSTLVQGWLDSRMLEVQCVNFVGYDKKNNAYIFPDNAWQNGKKIKLNEHGYFNLSKRGVKSALSGFDMSTEGEFINGWFSNYIKAFSYQGLAVLAFWLGTLFVQQIRKKQSAFTFLEFTGEPGSGKTTVLEYCWKLVGRNEQEGFDVVKSSQAGRRRALSQVSNLPVVIIESDRDSGIDGQRVKQFNFDEFKPFWNGRTTGTIGVATKGNETKDEPFLASLLISQNAEVDGSQPTLERIVHCHMDKKHHRNGTRELARWFEMQTADTVGGFLGEVLKQEKEILATYFNAYNRMEKRFSGVEGVSNIRIIQNHAQVAACAHALKLIFPSMTEATLEDFVTYLETRARVRQERIAADHPLVEKFWETYDYINDKSETDVLNHAADLKTSIAINLNDYREKCIDYGQELTDLTQLKKMLLGSKRHKFVEKNKPMRSRVLSRSMRCWIFEK